jgi:hypothetical protein
MKCEIVSNLPFFEPEFAESWSEWLEYRKQRKIAKYTQIGIGKTLNALLKDSGGDYRVAIKIIDQSIEKNWQGLFPLKNTNNDRTKQSINGSGKQNGLVRFIEKARTNYESNFGRTANT